MSTMVPIGQGQAIQPGSEFLHHIYSPAGNGGNVHITIDLSQVAKTLQGIENAQISAKKILVGALESTKRNLSERIYEVIKVAFGAAAAYAIMKALYIPRTPDQHYSQNTKSLVRKINQIPVLSGLIGLAAENPKGYAMTVLALYAYWKFSKS